MPSLLNNESLRYLAELAEGTPAGAFVEVGVYQGGSAGVLAGIAERQDRALYLYDTFTGIPMYEPENGDAHRIGEFSDTSLEAVRALVPKAVILPGVFPGTIVDMGPIAFAHIDADQYRSVKDSIAYLWPQIVPGGVMLFDDYKCLDGATKAVAETFGHDLPATPNGKVYAIKGQA
jgi:O-methyltransferase